MDRRSVSLQASIDDIKNHQPQQVITNPVELFQARLNSFRLRVECVTQDHEVGFRVLSFSVFGRETAYDLMKNLVYNQIQSNKNLYEPLINKDGHDFNNYCQQLLTGPLPAYEDCTWMQAVSDLFRVTLRILWDDQRVIFTEISPLAAYRQVLSMKTLWLGCSLNFSWFQPLVPLNFSVQPSIDDPYVKFYNLMALYNQPSFNDTFEVCHRIFSHLSSTRVPKSQYRRHSMRIKEFNFERIAVDGDGNCCFRTLSFLLSKTDDYHDLVRALAVLQIRSNPGRYQSLCVLLKPPEVKVPETLDRYLIRMAKLGTWGDDGCIQAIVDLCRIKITDLNSQMHVLYEYVPQGFYYKEGFICRNTHHMEPLLPTADCISQALLAKSMSRCNFSGYMTRCLSRGYLNEVSDKVVSSQRQNMDKTRMNFVVIGPENSGKSTTTGHLIYKLGGVAKSLIDELENDCAKMDRPSYQYAWVLDTLKAERERRCTIDISSLKFETPRFSCTAVDAPGKNCFIKNLIAGTSQADCAVLVIDSSTNAFKADQSGGKQMREHALLAFTFGVRQIICCCNKMDETIPKYSEERYNEIVNEVQFNLKDVGYKPEGIHFVPVSGFWGENLTDRSSDIDLDWYKGPTLVETIDSLSEPKRPSGMPLRLPICGAYNIPGIGTVPVGRVESGILKSGMEVTFGPTGLTAKVNSIQMHGKEVVEAMPGDIVSFSLQNASQNVPGEVVKRGYVASNSFEDPVKGARSFVAQVIIINPFGKIENKYTPVIHCHTSYGAAKFTLLSKIDRMTGKELETRPMSLIVGDCAIVKLTLKKPLVVEPFMEYPPLGWFAARDMDRTVAVGVIKSVDKMYP